MLTQRSIQASGELGHRLPQRVLHHCKTPAGLVYRGGLGPPKIIAVPDLCDQFAQPQPQLDTLPLGVALKLQLPETATDFAVLVNQRAPGNFRGMRGQHQLNIKPAHGSGNFVCRHFPRLQFSQRCAQGLCSGKYRVHGTRQGVLQIGHVGQVEKLAESPGHWHQLAVVHSVQHSQQRRVRLGVALARQFGQRTNALYQRQEILSLSVRHHLAQQATEVTYVAA